MIDRDIAAFPSPYTLPGNQGMSLRDYFAAKALPWVLEDIKLDMDSVSDGFIEAAAEWSYAMADAMIKARERS